MMQRVLQYFLLVACCGGLLLTGNQSAVAQSGSERVDAALKTLHQWIGGGEKGEGWRQFLMSDALEAEMEKGEQADRLVLRAVLERYRGSEKGLDMWRFVAVRQALQAWLEDLPPLAASQLAAAAREVQDVFAPKTDSDVRQARQQLDQAVAGLDRLMARWDSESRTDWQEYLDWQSVKDQLAAENPDRDKLRTVLGKFYANREGLEASQFVAVREALQAYVNVQAFAGSERARELYEGFAEELAKRLETYQQHPNTEDAVRIGQIVGWMSQYGQATELTEAVRHHLVRPNLFVQFSEDMMRTGIETDIEEQSGVRENILGTDIRGSATMKGRLSIDLIPSQNNASIDLLLTGMTYSNNRGYNGPVTILSTGVTSVNARKRVLIEAEGISVQRARAGCRTSSRINGISARSPLIERVAWRRAGKTKPQVEAIASKRAARRIAAQMDTEVVEVLAPAKELFAEKFRNPLVRRGGFPQQFLLRTSDDRLYIQATQASMDQLGAPDEPPALTADHDVAARIHDSLVGNLSQAYLGGVTWTDERIALLAERLTGDIPPALEITRDDPPWSITFANERPLDARFDENRITMFLRARRFTRGDQELRENVEVSAVYEIEKTQGGSRLTRQGDVNVKFGDAKTLSVGNVAMKTFVRNKFESLFQEKFESEGIALPGRWQMAGKMRLDQLHCGGGWLALGWHQPTFEARVALRD